MIDKIDEEAADRANETDVDINSDLDSDLDSDCFFHYFINLTDDTVFVVFSQIISSAQLA